MPTITIDPLPPTQGSAATVTYDGGPTTLKLDWTPTGAGPAELTIPKGGTAQISIPDNATSLVITDPAGGATALSTMIGMA